VILVDANLLLYAHDSSSPSHPAARSWLEAVLGGDEPIGIPLISLLAFLRLATNPVVFERPMSTKDAGKAVEGWLARGHVTTPGPGDRHWQILGELAIKGQARGARLMDAHLAALAIEYGAVLATADRGFARFPGLRVTNPIPD
jgi:uncharacterized protein